MIRMVSGVCALGLLAGSYFVCPEGVKNRVQEALSPPDHTLAELQAGLDALTNHFNGPGDMTPDVSLGQAARE
ncbi:MAG: hypothetical protein RKE49_07895 [Oceanicaulis sp.]